MSHPDGARATRVERPVSNCTGRRATDAKVPCRFRWQPGFGPDSPRAYLSRARSPCSDPSDSHLRIRLAVRLCHGLLIHPWTSDHVDRRLVRRCAGRGVVCPSGRGRHHTFDHRRGYRCLFMERQGFRLDRFVFDRSDPWLRICILGVRSDVRRALRSIDARRFRHRIGIVPVRDIRAVLPLILLADRVTGHGRLLWRRALAMGIATSAVAATTLRVIDASDAFFLI